jgi:LemA protein
MYIYVLLVILVLLFLYIASSYNGLVGRRNRVKDCWSQIDIQLKRRFDLIPNLVSTVKGYTQYEAETLQKITEARSKFMKAYSPGEAMEANGDLTKELSRLAVVVERYPNLKASESYTNLQNQLVETENKISFARQFYSDTVMNYNNSVQSFPSNIIASMFNFKEAAFFETSEAERENIDVKLQ